MENIRYIEKAGRQLIVEFFRAGGVKAIHEWTGTGSAAKAVKLDGEKHREAIEFLAKNYKRRAYHDELSRLRRAEARGMKFIKYVSVI